MDTQVGYELRVLSGPQAGAHLGLVIGAEIKVGSLAARGYQVVLRDPRVQEQRLVLQVRANDVRVQVLQGSVDMAGQVLNGPCSADWPHYVGLRVGDTVLAVGQTGDARWDAVRMTQAADEAAAPSQPAEAVQEAAAAPAHTAAPAAAAPGPRRRVEAWLAVAGGVLTVTALSLLGLVSLVSPAQGDAGTERQRILKALKADAFRGLHVELSQDGRLHVRGDLLTLADRAALDRALQQAEVEPELQVRVGEQVVAAVRDVFRMNGVVAEAQPLKALADVGNVQVKTHERDVGRLQTVAAAAKRDVPGLSVLKVDNQEPAALPQVSGPVAHDPGKRVASVVPGETPYVVTVDGTRYFIGAMLPSGHRLASITDQQVLLSKDGMVSPLSF
jgi:type III secretion protein D